MYKLNFNTLIGKVSSIQFNENTSIPVAEGNTDYQQFLEWNKTADKPLDLKSTIPVVVPEKARDLAKEIDEMKTTLTAVSANIYELKSVDLKAEL